MPLDLELQKKATEQELMALLSGQKNSLPADIQGIQSKVQGSRDFSPGTDFLSSLGISAPQDTSFQTNALNRELSKRMATSKFNLSRQNLSNKSDALTTSQDQATQARRARELNARNVSSVNSQEAFLRSEGVKSRNLSTQVQDIQENATKRGLDQELQYADYQPGNPLVRMLSTLGGTVGTSLLLRQAMAPKDTGGTGVQNYGFLDPNKFDTGYGGSGSTFADLYRRST